MGGRGSSSTAGRVATVRSVANALDRDLGVAERRAVVVMAADGATTAEVAAEIERRERKRMERRERRLVAERVAEAANAQARNDNERTILYLNQPDNYDKPDITTTVVALEGLPVGTTIAHSVRRGGITGGTTGNGVGESIFQKTRSGEWRSGSTGYGLRNSLWTPEDVATALRTSTGIRFIRDWR